MTTFDYTILFYEGAIFEHSAAYSPKRYAGTNDLVIACHLATELLNAEQNRWRSAVIDSATGAVLYRQVMIRGGGVYPARKGESDWNTTPKD